MTLRELVLILLESEFVGINDDSIDRCFIITYFMQCSLLKRFIQSLMTQSYHTIIYDYMNPLDCTSLYKVNFIL